MIRKRKPSKAYTKISEGLNEVLAVARGQRKPVVFKYERPKRLTPKQIAAERKQIIHDIRQAIARPADLATAYSEAIRLSGIALLSAACFADEHGDKKAGAFYEKRGYANLKLIDRGPPDWSDWPAKRGRKKK